MKTQKTGEVSVLHLPQKPNRKLSGKQSEKSKKGGGGGGGGIVPL